MKNKTRLVALAPGFFVLFLTGLTLAEDFSADMISTSQAGVSKGKMFISNDKVRMEVPEAITISRKDKGVVWILIPQEKMYMEQALDPNKAVSTSEKIEGEIERKLVGKEMADGRMADKYQITYDVTGRRVTIFQWLVPGLMLPVKTAAADNSWVMEYKNIKTGKQPDSLFEIPAGYQKFSYEMPSMKDVLGGL